MNTDFGEMKIKDLINYSKSLLQNPDKLKEYSLLLKEYLKEWEKKLIKARDEGFKLKQEQKNND